MMTIFVSFIVGVVVAVTLWVSIRSIFTDAMSSRYRRYQPPYSRHRPSYPEYSPYPVYEERLNSSPGCLFVLIGLFILILFFRYISSDLNFDTKTCKISGTYVDNRLSTSFSCDIDTTRKTIILKSANEGFLLSGNILEKSLDLHFSGFLDGKNVFGEVKPQRDRELIPQEYCNKIDVNVFLDSLLKHKIMTLYLEK